MGRGMDNGVTSAVSHVRTDDCRTMIAACSGLVLHV